MGWGPRQPSVEEDVPPPCLSFSDISVVWGCAEVGYLITVWGGWSPRLPPGSLLAGLEVSPQFFLPCLAGVVQLLSALQGGPLPGPLVRERVLAFVGVFFVCVSWHFQVVGFKSPRSGIYEAKTKQKHRELTMGPEVPADLLSFLHFSESSVKYIFALDVMSRVLIVPSGRNREEYVHSIFPEVQVLVCFVLFVKKRIGCFGY